MSQPEPGDKTAAGPRPAAVVWDLDGTLAESAPDLATALNALLTESGQRTFSVEAVRLMVGGGVPKLIERGFRAAGKPLGEPAVNAVLPRFMELYRACATDSTHLRPGALEQLAHFRAAGARQGLCTNKPFDVTRLIIEALGIASYFDSVVGGDSTSARKPEALPLLTCLAQLGAEPGDAVMVGDSGADIGAARAAGVAVIAVAGGYTAKPAGELGADRVAGNLADVARIAGELATEPAET